MVTAQTAELRNQLALEAEYAERLASWSDIVEQMPLLYDVARAYRRPRIAELGTRTGQSTCALLAGAAPTLGHVWSVDNGSVTVPAWWRETGLWSFLDADDMSVYAANWVPAQLDVLFIDTSHLYDHTLAELRRYAPRVRPGGTVLCHDVELTRDAEPRLADYPKAGLMGWDWLAEAAKGPLYPVAAALDTYCTETGLTWTRQSDRPDLAPGKPFYGLGTILIPDA